MKQALLKTNGKTYVIESPSIRQFTDIESRKVSLAAGQYGSLCVSRTVSSTIALDMIDMAATLTVLCPDLMSDLKADIGDLSIGDSSTLLKDYNRDVKPFTESWIKDFKDFLKGQEDEHAETGNDITGETKKG